LRHSAAPRRHLRDAKRQHGPCKERIRHTPVTSIGYPGGIETIQKKEAERFRIMAAECERQAKLATEEDDFREMQEKLANSFHALAETEDWLDGRAENPLRAPRGEAGEKIFEVA
jgi:hypothetical protein